MTKGTNLNTSEYGSNQDIENQLIKPVANAQL